MSGGFAGIPAFMLYLHKKTDTRFDNLEARMDHRFEVVSADLKDIDRRLCRLEGAFASKDC